MQFQYKNNAVFAIKFNFNKLIVRSFWVGRFFPVLL